ncbi:uncharacterized protein TNCV_1810021 [Trichonephila clavipes]|nr:uncharacterized protein TNCV_1810021 [Trichonephila clavipes]
MIIPVYRQMSAKTVEKRRKRYWSLYLMLRKVINKTWITSDKALFHLTFTTGETKIQQISREKRRKDAALLEKASKPPGVIVWTGMSSHGLTKPFFVEPESKINVKYYHNKVLNHLVRENKRLYSQGNFVFHLDCAPNPTAKLTIKWLKNKNK